MTTGPTEQPAIPGLDVERKPGTSNVEAAVRSTFEALHALGRITPTDAGKVATAIELAQVMSQKRASGRASTISNDARLLTEILDSFRTEDKKADDRLAQAMEAWEAAMAAAEAAGPP